MQCDIIFTQQYNSDEVLNGKGISNYTLMQNIIHLLQRRNSSVNYTFHNYFSGVLYPCCMTCVR
jgi:hypothetical protein